MKVPKFKPQLTRSPLQQIIAAAEAIAKQLVQADLVKQKLAMEEARLKAKAARDNLESQKTAKEREYEAKARLATLELTRLEAEMVA